MRRRPLWGGAAFGGVFLIDLPLAARGIAAGAVLAGASRMKTETLPMAVYLNMVTGALETAVACVLLLLLIAFRHVDGFAPVGQGGVRRRGANAR